MEAVPYIGRLKPNDRILIILALGVLSRVALFATSAHIVLQKRPELSTPLTSWRSLQEGIFLYQKGVDPYAGGVFYHSPIYLFVFSALLSRLPELSSAIIWILSDISVSFSLLQIWDSRSKGPVARRSRAPLVLAIYLLNPYAIASCASRATTSIDNALLIGAVARAAQGHTISASILLAVVAHSSMYPLLILVPLLLLSTSKKDTRGLFVSGLLAFIATLGGLSGIAIGVLGQTWPKQTWGAILSVQDLTPNVGMWWYFFTEVFDHFRTFFLGVFQFHNLIYVVPVCVRLKHDPLVAILVLLGIQSTWKSYPALGDLALWGGLLSCFPEIVSDLRHPLFTLSVYLYTTILLPLLHSLWLVTGAGNANFFYAATMVYGLNSSLAVVDVLTAAFKADFRKEAMKDIITDDNDLGREEPEDGVAFWTKRNWFVVQFTSLRR